MQTIKINSTRGHGFLIISLMLLLFCIMKVIRGTDTASTQAGGVWNYISLLYYPIVLLIVYRRRRLRVYPVFVFLAFYVFWALAATLLNFYGALTVNRIYSILMIPHFALVLLAFYSLSDRRNNICSKILLLTFYVCLAVNLYSIIQFQFMGNRRPLASDIYFSLALFPFTLILLNSKFLKGITTLGMFAAVFFSGKRTGLIAFLLAIICYYLLEGRVEGKKSLGKRIHIIVNILLLVSLFYIMSAKIDNIYNLGIYKRLLSVFDDGGSGREDIYITVWNAFCDAPLTKKLFGHGRYASENITFARAHNDFLEILYDYGIFAFLFFVGFYLTLFSTLTKMIRNNSPYAPAYACSVIISVFLSMFSFYMTYYTYVTAGVAVIGYCISCERSRIAELRR